MRVVRVASVCVDVFAIVADIDLSKGCILCSKGAFCEFEFNVVIDIDRMGVGCDLILKSVLRPVDDDFQGWGFESGICIECWRPIQGVRLIL